MSVISLSRQVIDSLTTDPWAPDGRLVNLAWRVWGACVLWTCSCLLRYSLLKGRWYPVEEEILVIAISVCRVEPRTILELWLHYSILHTKKEFSILLGSWRSEEPTLLDWLAHGLGSKMLWLDSPLWDKLEFHVNTRIILYSTCAISYGTGSSHSRIPWNVYNWYMLNLLWTYGPGLELWGSHNTRTMQ